MSQSPRFRAIYIELEKGMNEYLAAKEKFETARVEFEAAREKSGGVRRLAEQMLPEEDFSICEFRHDKVQYVGSAIGDAILTALRRQAVGYAYEREEICSPAMDLDEITSALEAGGFEFRAASARREVNAALINLKGITKIEDHETGYPGYQLDSETGGELMQKAKERADREAEEEEEAAEAVESKKKR